MAELQMEGWAEIKSRLVDLPDKLVKSVLDQSMRQAANVVREAARENFDRGDPYPNEISGALRASIRTVRRRGTPTRVVYNVVAGGDFSSAKAAKYGVKAAYYALFVEMGHWVNTGKALGGSKKDAARERRIAAGETSFVKPHPFMRPAIEQNAQLAVDFVMVGVSDRLPELVR